MHSSISLIWTITAGATLLQAGNGLFTALLPLRMQAQGLPIMAIGMVATGYGLGFASGCLLAPAFVRRVGHIRAFASLAAVAAVVALAFTQAHSIVAWITLRALTGVTLAGLFTVIDGWVSARAVSTHRGRVLSIYMVCTKIALMVSPLGIGLGDVRTDGLFMAASAMMCLSLLPVSGALTDEPPPPRNVRIDVKALFSVAPTAVVGAFSLGLVNGPVIAIAPVFGVGIGMSQDEAAALLVALQGGSLLLQWPLGWLSDHIDRRYVIAGLAAGTGLVSMAIIWASTTPPPIVILCFGLWGGLALCIYPVCVAHASDLVEPGQIVVTVSNLLVSWAAGMMIGPLLGAMIMDLVGPAGLFMYSASVSLLFAAFVALRIVKRARPTAGHGFIDIAPTSPVTAAMSPRADAKPEQVEV